MSKFNYPCKTLQGLHELPDLTVKELHILPTQISDVKVLRRLCFLQCKFCDKG